MRIFIHNNIYEIYASPCELVQPIFVRFPSEAVILSVNKLPLSNTPSPATAARAVTMDDVSSEAFLMLSFKYVIILFLWSSSCTSI